jgi:hypothetical protein
VARWAKYVNQNNTDDEHTMKTFASILRLTLAVATLWPAAAGAANRVNFDRDRVGEAPPGWTVAITGEGIPVWRVVADDSAPSRPHVLSNPVKRPGPVSRFA